MNYTTFANYKISIITATMNSESTIRSTIDSILKQQYAPAEHIIVDGKSYDNTLDIINSYKKEYEDKGIKLVVSSAKDNGIYDAFNRGIKLSNGDVIGFLNSDDFFINDNVLEYINWAFNKPSKNRVETISANVYYVDSNSQIIRRYQGRRITPKNFRNGFHPAHPTFYIKKYLFDKYGLFNTSYKIAGDYELMLRMIMKNNVSNLYIDDDIVAMRIGGISNQNIGNIYKANIECMKAWRDNGMNISPIFILLKPLQKVKGISFVKYIKHIIDKFMKRGGGQRLSYNTKLLLFPKINYVNRVAI